jgi:hypothetical protein
MVAIKTGPTKMTVIKEALRQSMMMMTKEKKRRMPVKKILTRTVNIDVSTLTYYIY